MKPTTRSSAPLGVLLVAALFVGSMGIAIGAPVAKEVTKSQVKKLVRKGIAQQAPSLSVASAANAGAVDGVDSANLVQSPGRLRVVAAAAIDTNGSVLTSVGQFTVAKIGTGHYRVTPIGTSVTLDAFILTATAGISSEVRALVQLGTANFFTSNPAGSPQDGAFQFVIYRTD